MLKFTRLLYSSVETDVFLDRIVPTVSQRKTLVDAKNDIRDYLRPRIRAATVTLLGMNKAVSPRFRTQGSWAYATCIQPAWRPPQEMDWDFGIYLPVSVWEEGGPPKQMAKRYFKLVEDLLKDLCKDKGWTLYSGKDTCIRVQIEAWAHIDLPLYAAPEAEFIMIMEKSATAALRAKVTRDSLSESAEMGEMPEQEWEELDHIAMATRSGEWKRSDPEAVSKWFEDRVLEHKDQLRRVCRYLKAWRDLHWKEGDGPTSVCLMIVVAQTFENIYGRDDLALEAAARALAVALRSDVREVGVDKGVEDFNKRLSAEEREHAAAKAHALATRLREALAMHGHRSGDAVELLMAQLGGRIPYRTDLVEVDGGAETVRATAAVEVARPVVKPTNSG